MEPRLLRLYHDVPIVTVSNSTRQDLEQLGLSNVWVVPNGRDDPPELNGLPKESVPTFLFVGRLALNKRPDHAVEAVRFIKERLPHPRLWLVGRGPLERKLQKTLPEGAEMLGYLPRVELYERMARAHCLLIPSVREGWGPVVIEAHSVGTPAVGYDVQGIRDSIKHERTGLLAEAGDPAALARQAVSLDHAPVRYSVVSEEATRWAYNFSCHSPATNLMHDLEECLLQTIGREPLELTADSPRMA